MGRDCIGMKKITIQEIYANELIQTNNWYRISSDYDLTEEIIDEFINKVNWSLICKYQKLNEKLIRKYINKVNWRLISKYQNLSESFINEFHNYVDWYWIGSRQNLSYEFIINNLYNDKLDPETIYCNKKIEKDIQNKLINYVKYVYRSNNF